MIDVMAACAGCSVPPGYGAVRRAAQKREGSAVNVSTGCLSGSGPQCAGRAHWMSFFTLLAADKMPEILNKVQKAAC